MRIFGRKTLVELMEDEIREGAEQGKGACAELHAEFEGRLQRRYRAREEFRLAQGKVQELQGVGVSLLRRLNAANAAGDEGKLEEFQKAYRQNSRLLDRVGRRRDQAARGLAADELDEREAAAELAQAGAAVVDEHAEHIAKLKQRLEGLIETLDKRHEEVAQSAVPLAEEHERRVEPTGEPRGEPPGELGEAE